MRAAALKADRQDDAERLEARGVMDAAFGEQSDRGRENNPWLTRFTRLPGLREAEPTLAATPIVPSAAEVAQAEIDTNNRVYTDVKVRLHQRLLEEINLTAIEKLPPEAFREQTGALITKLLKAERVQLKPAEQAQITNDVIDEMIGLGPLEPLLKDTTVNDILVNTHRQVFVERAGRLELTPVIFQDERHLLRIISKIVSAVGRRVDESQPMVDARLPDGSPRQCRDLSGRDRRAAGLDPQVRGPSLQPLNFWSPTEPSRWRWRRFCAASCVPAERAHLGGNGLRQDDDC